MVRVRADHGLRVVPFHVGRAKREVKARRRMLARKRASMRRSGRPGAAPETGNGRREAAKAHEPQPAATLHFLYFCRVRLAHKEKRKMPDTAQIVQSMNAGWRNYVNDAMRLSRETFQLAQGTLGLQTPDSSGPFLMEDAVPPSSTVGYYSSSTTKSRSSAYLTLLSALLPETSPVAL
jgi:hypothetical protein